MTKGREKALQAQTMGKATDSPIEKVEEIEGIRGVLSIIVLIGHVKPVLVLWFWGCMEVFFAISGYLMCRIAIEYRSSPRFWNTYLLRRVYRIWPLYFVVYAFCLTFALVAEPIPGSSPHIVGWGAVREAFFLQNTKLLFHLYAIAHKPEDGYLEMFGPAWSVAMEDHFYLLAPVMAWVLLWLVRRTYGRRALAAVGLLAFAGICNTIRAAGISWWVFPGRADAFVLGGLVAAIAAHSMRTQADLTKIRWWTARLFVIASILTAVFAAAYYVPKIYEYTQGSWFELRQTAGVTLFAVFGASLTAVCVFKCFPSILAPLRLAPLQFLGTISYSTYLWHMPIIQMLGRMDWYSKLLPHGFHTPAAIAVVIPISYASHQWIEKPPLRFKRAFSPPDHRQT